VLSRQPGGPQKVGSASIYLDQRPQVKRLAQLKSKKPISGGFFLFFLLSPPRPRGKFARPASVAIPRNAEMSRIGLDKDAGKP